ncbi:MAG: hypothetical protein ACXW1U_10690 [Methylobacter sp.]
MNNKHQFSAVKGENLFRYLSYEKFESLIETSALFFSRMDLMSDKKEGTLYRSGGQSNVVYGSCWRRRDYGNYKDLFKNYECEDGVIIKTSEASLRDCFNIFGTYRRKIDFQQPSISSQQSSDVVHMSWVVESTAWGLYFPYVFIANVAYTNKNHKDIDFGNDIEMLLAEGAWNVHDHLKPFLLKKKKYEYEQELRIFTRWQTITMNYTTFLPGYAFFEKCTGELIKRRCTCAKDISSIEEEVMNRATDSIDFIDQMQPTGFFYPFNLNIIEAIYTQESSKNEIKKLLDNSKYSYLSNKLIIL